MNGTTQQSDTSEEADSERCCTFWERLWCARATRACRRRFGRVAPETGFSGKTRSRESRRRVNRPPTALYSSLSERVRISTPAALQCALFCGGSRCQYELPRQGNSAVQGLYSDWVTDDILAMARPSTVGIAARNIIQQFHSWGIRTVINLQTPGEHASCGPALTKSGFTYDPNVFMSNDIYYYNFAWPDYGEASLSGLLDMAKVLSFALQEGRVAIHCHAAVCALLLIFTPIIGYRLWMEPFKGVCSCTTRLHGKVALVTGGNSGIGLETAKDLANRGATVVIASRNDSKSEEAVGIIKQATGNNNVEYRHLNLAKQESIVDFASKFNKDFNRLDVLVNNAGSGAVRTINTENGVDMLMQINYVGPFLLTNLLLDKLVVPKTSRIVIVSSYAHAFAPNFTLDDITKTWKEQSFLRYANTKLCDVLWTRELAKRLPRGVTVNTLHPGIVSTSIFNNLAPFIKKIILVITFLLFKNATEGAQTTIHLCVSPKLEDSTGGYYVDCKKTKCAKIAENDDLAIKVWERTVQLTKL
ncbi:jg11370 [Pararge aegeria aegeria]|uniref:Jg11370 protein n=1 Tax=Pararge aegeria aegeria TaxID=348720 RepID=A0A8S4RLP6_9NEOP|nr:jg11370 [Pararge aegeria aegeria]